MKTSLIMTVLSLAASITASFGQGQVEFTTWLCNGGAGAMTYFHGTYNYVDVPFTAELIWAPGTVADPVDFASATSISSLPSGSLSPATGSFTAAYNRLIFPGEFYGGVAVLPGYTGGAVTFEILA